MAVQRTSFEKLQRDRAKKAKAAAKREKRLDKTEPGDETTEDVLSVPTTLAAGEELSADALLKMVAELHEQFESEKISFEEFEDRKTELFALLSVD